MCLVVSVDAGDREDTDPGEDNKGGAVQDGTNIGQQVPSNSILNEKIYII